MIKKIFAFLLIVTLAFGLVACGGGNSNSPAPGSNSPTASGSTPASPAKPVEVTAAISGIPNGLDPVSEDSNPSITTCDHFYDHLIKFDENWNWNPAVAKSWKQIDSKTWELEINLDYVFQNGEKLTMDDVVYSIERLKNIPKSADFAKHVSTSYKDNILTLSFDIEDNTLLTKVNHIAVIVNKAYIEAGGDDAIYKNPIGTGPYKVTEFTPGASITLETWDGYPFAKPQIDILKLIAIPDNSNRYISVESGQNQYAGLVTAFEADLAKQNTKLSLSEKESARYCGFEINTEKAPLNDVNVRRALAYALDRDSMCALQGGRPPLKSVVFCGFSDYYNESQYLPEFDLDKAKQLFEAAGITPANPLDLEICFWQSDPCLELYQSTLKPLGVNVTLNLLEFSVWVTKEGAGDFQKMWTGLINRGGALLDLERLDSAYIGTRNNTRLANPAVDALIWQMRTTTDDSKLKDLAKQISDIAAQDCAFIPVYLQTMYSVMDKNLTGVTLRGDMVQDFRHAVYTG